MMQLYTECDSIPQYIQLLKKAQRRSIYGNLPVANNIPTATAINALLSTGDYKDNMTTWLGKGDTERTWTNFKKHFSKVYLTEEQQNKYFGEEAHPGQPFGGDVAPQQPQPPINNAAGITINNDFPA